MTTMQPLRYDDEAHAYYRGDVRLASVTGIINAVWPRSDGAPEDAIEKARMRGSWVDEKFMEYLTTGCVTVPEGTPQEYADCLGQAVDWWEAERKGLPVECQVRLFGEREAGTADLIVGGYSILELKSTWKIAETVAAQLGGYATIREESGLHTSHFGVLHVHRRFKKAQFREIDYKEAFRQWKVVRDFYRLTVGKS